MSSAEVKVLERLVRARRAHLRGEDRVDDDDVRGRRRLLASRKRVGERQRPALGRRLGRAVGGVGAARALGLRGGDEDEAAVLGARRAAS